MATRKYHLILGLICLCISIILPTITYHYFISINGLILFNPEGFGTTLIELNSFELLLVLLTIWLASLFFALRELGGFMLQIGQSESETRHKFHNSFHQNYLDSH